MNEAFDAALHLLQQIVDSDDLRWLREYLREKQGFPAQLQGIAGGYGSYVLREALQATVPAVDRLSQDDVKSCELVVTLLYEALRPKAGGKARGHVQLKTLKRSYVQFDYSGKNPQPLLDANGEPVLEDFYYTYAYVRLHAGKGNKDRQRQRLLSLYADRGMGKGGKGGIVASALEGHLITEDDILDAFHTGEEAYQAFIDQCQMLLRTAGILHDSAEPTKEQRALVPTTPLSASVPAPAVQGAYQLKISVEEVQPVIWRRIRVPASITFAELHHIIQLAMGWEDYHLYQFLMDDYAFRGQTMGSGDRLASEPLAKYLVEPGTVFGYEYDFGDQWEHVLVVEKWLESAGGPPVCLAGKRACPPEDCGGSWAYMEYLAAKKKRRIPQRLKEQFGRDYDPDAFDLDEVNQALKQYWSERQAPERPG